MKSSSDETLSLTLIVTVFALIGSFNNSFAFSTMIWFLCFLKWDSMLLTAQCVFLKHANLLWQYGQDTRHFKRSSKTTKSLISSVLRSRNRSMLLQKFCNFSINCFFRSSDLDSTVAAGAVSSIDCKGFGAYNFLCFFDTFKLFNLFGIASKRARLPGRNLNVSRFS